MLPAVVYLLSYVPWMRQGHSVMDVVRLQGEIWSYHANLRASHTYYSAWWTWPLPLPADLVLLGTRARASCAASSRSATRPSGGLRCRPRSGRSCTGSARGSPRLVFAGAGFFFLYLPWGVSPRTLNFSHYLFEAIPYACLSLGLLLDREWDSRWRLAAWGYLATAALLFLLFLPFLTALPVPTSLWAWRFPGGGGLWTWFPTWI